MKASRFFLTIAMLLGSGLSYSDTSVVGKVHMIQPYIPQGLVYIHLDGHPNLNGGGCTSSYFTARMDDENFKAYIYSILLSAKVSKEDIKIIVNGCNGNYPNVVSVEFSPRQP